MAINLPSQRNDLPIIKILRAYSRVDYSKRGFQFSDATIDQLNSNYLSSWGFIQKRNVNINGVSSGILEDT